jgi:hypothetical protein
MRRRRCMCAEWHAVPYGICSDRNVRRPTTGIISRPSLWQTQA